MSLTRRSMLLAGAGAATLTAFPQTAGASTTRPTTAAPLTPRQAAEALAAGVTTGQVPRIFAEDAVYLRPFALPGTTARVEGASQILDFFRSAPAGPLQVQHVTPTYYEAADGLTVVMELAIDGVNGQSGEAFAFESSIGVLKVSGGLVTEWHDYSHTIAGAVAAGTVPQLVDTLETLE